MTLELPTKITYGSADVKAYYDELAKDITLPEKFSFGEQHTNEQMRFGVTEKIVLAVGIFLSCVIAYYLFDGRTRDTELRKSGLARNSVFIIIKDGVVLQGNNDLIHRNVSIDRIKNAAMREFIIAKMTKCNAAASPNTLVYIDVADGAFSCVIDGRIVEVRL